MAGCVLMIPYLRTGLYNKGDCIDLDFTCTYYSQVALRQNSCKGSGLSQAPVTRRGHSTGSLDGPESEPSQVAASANTGLPFSASSVIPSILIA